MNHDTTDHKDFIHYRIDDEPESTLKKSLTAHQIMHNAGIDPKKNYLEQHIKGAPPISYKDNPEQEIELKDGMLFITKHIGAMPVS